MSKWMEVGGQYGWWVAVTTAFVLGALGGLAQSFVNREKGDTTWRPWSGIVIGIVAAVGSLLVVPYETWSAPAFIGYCSLAGFFGTSVLASLKTQLDLIAETRKNAKLDRVAEDAITEAETGHDQLQRAATPAAPPVPSLKLVQLRARLAAARTERF